VNWYWQTCIRRKIIVSEIHSVPLLQSVAPRPRTAFSVVSSHDAFDLHIFKVFCINMRSLYAKFKLSTLKTVKGVWSDGWTTWAKFYHPGMVVKILTLYMISTLHSTAPFLALRACLSNIGPSQLTHHTSNKISMHTKMVWHKAEWSWH